MTETTSPPQNSSVIDTLYLNDLGWEVVDDDPSEVASAHDVGSTIDLTEDSGPTERDSGVGDEGKSESNAFEHLTPDEVIEPGEEYLFRKGGEDQAVEATVRRISGTESHTDPVDNSGSSDADLKEKFARYGMSAFARDLREHANQQDGDKTGESSPSADAENEKQSNSAKTTSEPGTEGEDSESNESDGSEKAPQPDTATETDAAEDPSEAVTQEHEAIADEGDIDTGSTPVQPPTAAKLFDFEQEADDPIPEPAEAERIPSEFIRSPAEMQRAEQRLAKLVEIAQRARRQYTEQLVEAPDIKDYVRQSTKRGTLRIKSKRQYEMMRYEYVQTVQQILDHYAKYPGLTGLLPEQLSNLGSENYRDVIAAMIIAQEKNLIGKTKAELLREKGGVAGRAMAAWQELGKKGKKGKALQIFLGVTVGLTATGVAGAFGGVAAIGATGAVARAMRGYAANYRGADELSEQERLGFTDEEMATLRRRIVRDIVKNKRPRGNDFQRAMGREIFDQNDAATAERRKQNNKAIAFAIGAVATGELLQHVGIGISSLRNPSLNIDSHSLQDLNVRGGQWLDERFGGGGGGRGSSSAGETSILSGLRTADELGGGIEAGDVADLGGAETVAEELGSAQNVEALADSLNVNISQDNPWVVARKLGQGQNTGGLIQQAVDKINSGLGTEQIIFDEVNNRLEYANGDLISNLDIGRVNGAMVAIAQGS